MRRSTLAGPPEVVAVALLGSLVETADVVARIVDVEAYGGADDAASHAFRGERTANRSMFGPAGHLYVYLSHGIHTCANVVCLPGGEPAAVLLRGAVVLEGHEAVARRRGREVVGGRLDGPGRLCQGLGIARDHDGVDLLDPSSPVRLVGGPLEASERVVAVPRVGLTKEVARPWRFVAEPSTPARQGGNGAGARRRRTVQWRP